MKTGIQNMKDFVLFFCNSEGEEGRLQEKDEVPTFSDFLHYILLTNESGENCLQKQSGRLIPPNYITKQIPCRSWFEVIFCQYI